MNNIIRVYITENCNSKCSNCFNANTRSNATMSVSRFREICYFFKSNGITAIKIMGGEPTIHPYFEEIMNIAQNSFQNVFLFTNAINKSILNFSPRETDAIIYNFRFGKLLTKEKLLLDQPGRRSLEIQVSLSTNIDVIFKEVLRVSTNCENRINPCLTFDCTENIFKNRQLLIEKYLKLWKQLEEADFIVGQDHLAPLCFIYGSNIRIPSSGCVCKEGCSGLIDASYNIRFCNQYSKPLGNLYRDSSLISFEEYQKLLSEEYKSLQSIVLNKLCNSCPFYDQYCNGGCFMAKDFIDTNSILDNTALQLLVK